MQDANTKMCEATPIGTTVNLIDARDNKAYRVRKMADSRCWMIDNLAYNINATPTTGKPAYSPTAILGGANTDSRAQYAQNTATYNIPNNGSSTPSYLYNWCAAMGDTSANCTATRAYTSGQPNTPQIGICPGKANGSGFRLPLSGAAPTTPGNGSNQSTVAATTASEFAKLDIWMGGTGTSNAKTYNKWMGTGTAADNWSGVLSGDYTGGGLGFQGTGGNWWSSAAASSTNGSRLLFYGGNINPRDTSSKSNGQAVRCIL